MQNNRDRVRAYGVAQFGLELDRGLVGLVGSLEGANVKLDMMSLPSGGAHELHEQTGKTSYEPIKLSVGMEVATPFIEWIEQFFTGNTVRHSGAMLAADLTFRERARREFTDALISEVTFPAMGSGNQASVLQVTLVPESVTFLPGSGQKLTPVSSEEQKRWSIGRFLFTIDGMESACRRTSKIDAITVKQQIIDQHVGGRSAPLKIPSRIQYPTISFSVPEADSGPLFAYFRAKGEEGGQGALTGSVEYQDNEGRALATLHFKGLLQANRSDRHDFKSDDYKLVKWDIKTSSVTFRRERS